MEKTIKIDGKDVRLKSTAGTPIRYKAQFRKDYFSELLKLAKLTSNKAFSQQGNNKEDSDEVDLSAISYEELEHFDFEVLYNFIWALAKTADNSIGEPLTWLDQFETFPIAEIFPQISDLLQSSIQTKKK